MAIPIEQSPAPGTARGAAHGVDLRRRLTAFLHMRRWRIAGWFSRMDAEVFSALLVSQLDRGESGGLAEIGVHHGRSFLLLNLAAQPSERSLAIDIFDEQEHNLDSSGLGNRRVFERNIRRFGNPSAVVVIQRSSLQLAAEEILAAVGRVRFFSIDGGHWFEAAMNDLCLAADTVSAHGVIALDDFSNPDFPEVAAAYYAWYREQQEDFVPFAITRGKLYICRRGQQEVHQAALRRSGYLEFNRKKTACLLGESVDVYTGYYGKGSISGWSKRYVQLCFPKLWESGRALASRRKGC